MAARAPIKAIVGLGNPGDRYAQTLHNAGFWVVDELARRHAVAFIAERRLHGALARLRSPAPDVRLCKPATYMNESGRAVQALIAFYKLEPHQVLVVHDDLDLPPGTARFKEGGGHGGHNGLRDITQHIGPDFRRLRIGIGHPGHRDAVLHYVLQKPAPGHRELIEDAIVRACDAVELLLSEGWDKAAQRLNTRRRKGAS